MLFSLSALSLCQSIDADGLIYLNKAWVVYTEYELVNEFWYPEDWNEDTMKAWRGLRKADKR